MIFWFVFTVSGVFGESKAQTAKIEEHLSEKKIIFQQELITVFEPFPLRRVYQERLIDTYGNKEAEKAYKKMISMNKLPVSGSNYTENMEWISQLSKDQKRQDFLEKIHNLNNVVLMSPFRFNAIDDHCWIIVTLNSTKFEGMELLRDLSMNLYEKCAVGVVDTSFPSNFELFKEVLGNAKVPTVFLKKSKQKMVEFEFHSEPEVKWNCFLLPVENWGKVLSNDHVTDKLFIQNIQKYLYDDLTEHDKIIAIYTPLNVLENPRKDLMYFLIQNYGKQREKAVLKQIERDLESKMFKSGSPEHAAAVAILMEKFNYENSLKDYLKKELKRRERLIREDLASGVEYVQRTYPVLNPDLSLYGPYFPSE